MTTIVTLEAIAIAILAVLVAGLLRAYAAVLQRLHQIDSGDGSPHPDSAAPVVHASSRSEWTEAFDVAGTTPTGESVVIRTVGVPRDTALLFLSTGCSSCAGFWEALRTPGVVRLPDAARLVVVTQGADYESPAEVRALAPPEFDVVLSSEAWSEYGVPGSPYVVLVDGATGRVRGEGTGQSWSQVAELLARGSGDAAYLTGGPSLVKPPSDARREAYLDRELLAAGILPGDPRLYAADASEHRE
jgi:hypothetical protein